MNQLVLSAYDITLFKKMRITIDDQDSTPSTRARVKTLWKQDQLQFGFMKTDQIKEECMKVERINANKLLSSSAKNKLT